MGGVTRVWMVGVLILSVPLCACGEGRSTSARSTPAATQVETTNPPGHAKFQGQDRDNYDNAKVSCGAFPARQVARELGVRGTNPVTIATAFANGFREAFRQAAFEGCLAGLRGARATR
jgi:hypothetical protein